MKFSLKYFVTAMVVGSLAFGGLSFAAATSKVPNIYNWSNYIGPDTVKQFEKETGIKVRYDTFDSNETLQAKLMAGNTGYDLVVPGSVFARLQIEAGLLQKIDTSKIPNWKNQDPKLLEKLASFDPGNQYLVDWRWGFYTVGINKQAVAEELGSTPMPENPWSLIFDPKYAKPLSKCGISVTDSAFDIIPAALVYLGLPYHSTNPADYKKVTQMLIKVRPYITKISTIGWIDDLVSKNVCVVASYAGDINIARYQAEETKAKFQIEALVPKSGAVLFFDTMAIPKDAKNVDNALKFINFVLDPKVSASLTNTVYYPGPVPSSVQYTAKNIVNNKSVFPSAEELDAMKPPVMINAKIRALQTRAWNNFKVGIAQ